MLPQFCKFSHRIVDESVINLRRLCVKHHNNTINDQIDSEDSENAITNKHKEKIHIIKCKNSKFDFYKDQTYPKFEPIPLASRGWHHRGSRGDHFTIYPVKTNNKGQLDESVTFKNISLNKQLIKNLEKQNIVNPTQIQVLSIPQILQGQNIVMTAETGCGKTFAFLLPILHQIIQWKASLPERELNSPLALIVTPSYDLTSQIYTEAKKLAKNLDLKIIKYVGGNSKRFANDPPVGEVDVIIASLGILSKLVTWDIYKLDYVRHVILDEADVLLDPTFINKMCSFLDKIPVPTQQYSNNSEFPNKVQLILSSATIPEDLPESLNIFANKQKLLIVTSGNQHQVTVPQKFLRLSPSDKSTMLLKLVKAKAKSKIPLIIFSNTTKACEYTKFFLQNNNVKCIQMHGNLPTELKKDRFKYFQNGHYNILTATDAGARGLDTTTVREIINFDFPLITSEYIHRCGRTGRIGSPENCRVINFISRPLEIILTSKIEFAIRKGKPIPMMDSIHNKENESEFLNYKLTSRNNRIKPTDNNLENVDFDTESCLQIPH